MSDLRVSVLKGYLQEYAVKPDMSPSLWKIAKACLDNPKVFFYAIKFPTDLSMQQFVQAILLSSGKQFNWYCRKSFLVLQDMLDNETSMSDYANYDVVFIEHGRGTMSNKILGQSINQVAVLRSPKKTFFLDRGGYVISDLMVPLVSVADLGVAISKSSVGRGEDL